MTHDLQTIETAIKHFCYQNGIDYTGILEVYNGGVWVDSSKINNDQIKMIKGYMKRLQEIGREGVVDPHSLAHIGGGLDIQPLSPKAFDGEKANYTYDDEVGVWTRVEMIDLRFKSNQPIQWLAYNNYKQLGHKRIPRKMKKRLRGMYKIGNQKKL